MATMEETPLLEDVHLNVEDETRETSTLQIVLLGKTGSGKSSLANTVFGGLAEFNVSHSAGSETKDCQFKTQTVNGRLLRLIDTPGLCDTELNNTKMTSDQLRFLIDCAPGVHTFLLLLKVEKYTMHEREMIKSLLNQFTKEALKYTTVVFTHGDQLPDEITIESWVEDNERMKDLVQECGGRCHVFDNKYWNNNDHPYRNNQVQTENLLNTIEETVKKNGGKCYTNEMLNILEKEIQQVQINDPGSSRKEAKKIVHKNLWSKLKNVVIGCGLGVLVGTVMIPVGVFLVPCAITGAVMAGVGAATAATAATSAVVVTAAAATSAVEGTSVAATAVASAVVGELAGQATKQKKEKEN